jgi:hypothetical protein
LGTAYYNGIDVDFFADVFNTVTSLQTLTFTSMDYKSYSQQIIPLLIAAIQRNRSTLRHIVLPDDLPNQSRPFLMGFITGVVEQLQSFAFSGDRERSTDLALLTLVRQCQTMEEISLAITATSEECDCGRGADDHTDDEADNDDICNRVKGISHALARVQADERMTIHITNSA